MRVLVLGCGPAGLFAAHAAIELGAEVQILSKKRKSEMYGAQSLHAEIPGLTDPHSFDIEYVFEGSLEQYLHKVYGPELPDDVTAPNLQGIVQAWDIRSAYARAWERYHDIIDPVPNLTGDWVKGYNALGFHKDMRADFIVSTIPAPAMCLEPEAQQFKKPGYPRGTHSFVTQDVWAIGDAPERGIFAPRLTFSNEIRYNGTADAGWYRASMIAGYAAVEWPIETKPPLEGLSRVQKPIKTNCDCPDKHFDGRLIRTGRYGSWSRESLAHNAYWDVRAKLQEAMV